MGEVYSINGTKLQNDETDQIALGLSREPCEDMVTAARMLLEKAEVGEITGMFCVYQYADGATGGVISGRRTFSILGRVEDVKRELLVDLD